MMPFVAVLAMNPCEYSRRRRGNRGNISPMKTLREMLAEARQVVPEEGPEDLQRRLKSDTPPVVIDVRDPDEYRDGHIEAAANISRGFLEFRIGGAVSDPSTPVVLYCQTGLPPAPAPWASWTATWSTSPIFNGRCCTRRPTSASRRSSRARARSRR